jgi:hypothetical protein
MMKSIVKLYKSYPSLFILNFQLGLYILAVALFWNPCICTFWCSLTVELNNVSETTKRVQSWLPLWYLLILIIDFYSFFIASLSEQRQSCMLIKLLSPCFYFGHGQNALSFLLFFCSFLSCPLGKIFLDLEGQFVTVFEIASMLDVILLFYYY